MASTDQELEVKFYMADLPGLQAKLEKMGSRCIQERVHEINLRFDTPDQALKQKSQVLRLRKDRDSRLTYKGPGQTRDGATLRTELEFTVGDFDVAKAFIEALGYQVTLMYEKYRAVYTMGEVLITLDEMPFGHFAEIEGPTGEAIQQATLLLGLDWETRILESYMVLFERARAALGFHFRDLSFENFSDLPVSEVALGVSQADHE